MNSAEINTRLHELLVADYDVPNEKGVPYIGWYWRDVDFDAESYRFGVIPAGPHDPITLEARMGFPDRPSDYVGFMENNKWDYSYTRPTAPEEWTEIKQRICGFIEEPSTETAKAVYELIQAVDEPHATS